MRVSTLFGETIRDVPSDADTVSHQLLLRAGFVRQLGAGIFSLLPLGWLTVRRIEQILREEMNAIGGQELSMPVVHPADLWKQTGRWHSIDQSLVRFKDREERDLVLAMTHEEVVAQLAASEIRSYRQLPQLVYQIQTKFRDEPRSRGGLIRVREFIMKDSYSLDSDIEGLRKTYREHYHAYFRIGIRAGLPLIAVKSDVGMMGGKSAHEFMYVTSIGEDTLALCGSCGYAANREVATFRRNAPAVEPALPVEKVATPGTATIQDLATFLNVEATRTAKVVFFRAAFADARPECVVLALVRGDMEVNPSQLAHAIGASALRAAHDEEIRDVGAVPGYASPIGIDRARALVVVDDLVATSPNLVGGANEKDYHLVNLNVPRDYQPDIAAPIAAVYEGAECTTCGSPLTVTRGVEVGNIFQLGTRYSNAMNANFTDEYGALRPIIMGSYGIGVGRMLACIAEEHNDERGLSWPVSVAPFDLSLLKLGKAPATASEADRIYDALKGAGFGVLYDDRDVSAGVKFADADLRGMPVRVTVSDRSLSAGGVEVQRRTARSGRIVPMESLVDALRSEIADMQRVLDAALEHIPAFPEGEAALTPTS